MPDVREVYEMVTKQKPPEPGALERQQKRQVRTARNRKFGAFAIAAAIGAAAIALILVMALGRTAPHRRTSPQPPTRLMRMRQRYRSPLASSRPMARSTRRR